MAGLPSTPTYNKRGEEDMFVSTVRVSVRVRARIVDHQQNHLLFQNIPGEIAGGS